MIYNGKVITYEKPSKKRYSLDHGHYMKETIKYKNTLKKNSYRLSSGP